MMTNGEKMKLLTIEPLRTDGNPNRLVLDISPIFAPSKAPTRVSLTLGDFNKIVSRILADPPLKDQIVAYWLAYKTVYQGDLGEEFFPARDYGDCLRQKCDPNDPVLAGAISLFLSDRIESNVLASVIEREVPDWAKDFKIEWLEE